MNGYTKIKNNSKTQNKSTLNKYKPKKNKNQCHGEGLGGKGLASRSSKFTFNLNCLFIRHSCCVLLIKRKLL